MQNFRLSISPNLHHDRLLLLKVYKISAKKLQKSFVSWHWRLMQNLRKNLVKYKNLVNFVPSTQKSLKFTLWFVPSVIIMFHLKKHIGVIFHDTESDIKFGGKLTYGLENSMRNLANFHHSTWKLGLRIGTFMGYFYPKQKMY